MATLGVVGKCGSALHRAARTGAMDELKRLLDEGQEVEEMNQRGNTPLHVAASFPREHAAVCLIGHGADKKRLGRRGRSVLHSAAEGGSVGLIKYFLEHGQDVEQVDSNGNAALHLAALSGKEEAAKYLIDCSADKKQLGRYDRCVLHFAAEGGSVSLIKYFLKHGQDIEQVDINGNTALHLAALRGKKEAAKYLINRGADKKRLDRYGKSVLHFSARGGSVGLIKYFLEHGQNIEQVDSDGNTALHLAALFGKEEAVKYLVNRGADKKRLDRYGKSVLHFAARGGSVSLIKYLLEHGQDIKQVDSDGNTALHLAALFGKEEAAKYLINRGANKKRLDRHGRCVLHFAAIGGSVGLIKYFLEHGQDIEQVDSDGNTALHLAAFSGKEEAAKYLMGRGADKKRLDRYGRCVLHFAAEGGSVGLIKGLLDHGDDINQMDDYGNSALHLAAVKGKEEMVRLLLARQADIHKINKRKESVLHCAVYGGSAAVVNYLLEHGQESENFEKMDNDGNNALHIAALKGNYEVVRLLISRGADGNAFNKKGESSLHVAAREGHPAILACLLEHDDIMLESLSREEDNPVHMAACGIDKTMLSYFLAFGASIGKYKRKVTNRKALSVLEKDSGYRDESEVKASFPMVSVGSARREKQLSSAVRNGDLNRIKTIAKKNEAALKANTQIMLEACKWGHTSVVKYLLDDLRIPAYLKGIQKSTPLHEAARRGHVRILKLLLARGTPIDARNGELETPLHQAAKWGKWPAATLLVKRGARVTASNIDGKTPMDLAKENDWDGVVKVLQDPCTALSTSKTELASLQEVCDGVVLGTVDLDEKLVKQNFVLENVHGIRDLWAGHKLLEIGQRFGKIPKELDGNYFFRRFYHGIVGKLYSNREMDVAQDILSSAEDQGLLRVGGTAAILGDELMMKKISESIGPVLFDLNLRVQRLENGVEEVRSAVYQIKQDNEMARRQSMYLAFLRLGLSFVPIAGGALGTSVEALGKFLESMNASGLELGDLCGLYTSMTDAAHPMLPDGKVMNDIEELESLRERLSPPFIDALPKIPRDQFLRILKECFERGIWELREILDELLEEMRRDKDFLNSTEAERVKIEDVSEEKQLSSSKGGKDDHLNEHLDKSIEQKEVIIESKEEEDSPISVERSCYGEDEASREEELGLQPSTARDQVREALLKSLTELRSNVSELKARVQTHVKTPREEELSYTFGVVEGVKKLLTDAMKRLSEENGTEERLPKD